MCFGRTTLPFTLSVLGLIGQPHDRPCTWSCPNHETTERNTGLTEEISDGNCLLRPSERVTIWVRVKEELTEGSPKLPQRQLRAMPLKCLVNLWRTAMANLA